MDTRCEGSRRRQNLRRGWHQEWASCLHIAHRTGASGRKGPDGGGKDPIGQVGGGGVGMVLETAGDSGGGLVPVEQ